MSKQRVSLTLEESLVERIDGEAERRGVNRSRLVEDIIDSHFSRKGIDTAVILCGDPDAKTLELHEGKPVLSHILDHLESEGISRAILLVGRNHEIEENFGSEYHGIALEYISEEDPSGTASALEKTRKRIDESFVALNGHVVADVDLKDMLEVHREEKRVATMALTTVERPSNYGVVRMKGHEIQGFEEKPEEGNEPSRLINAGTYILKPEIFSHLDHDSLEKVFESLAESGELSGYIYGGKWREV